MKKKILALVLAMVLTCSLVACNTNATSAKLDFVGVTMTDASYVYDGVEKKIEVAGAPDGASVSYTSNVMTNAGEITATAVIAKDGYNTLTLKAKLTITKAALTCTADNAAIIIGSAIPTFTATYSGFVNNETATVLEGALSYTCSAGAESPVGVYKITPKGVTASNYEISFVAGKLTIGNVVATSVSITNAEQIIEGNTLKLTSAVLPANAAQKVTYALKSATLGVSITGDTITLSSESVTDAEFTVVVTVVGTTITAENTFTVGYRGEFIPITSELELRTALFTKFELNYELKNDIALTSTEPWGNVTYNGNFDGKGHSITEFNAVDSVVNMPYGFFSIIGANASVKNLRVKGNIHTVNSWSGGFVGANNGTIENCISEIDIMSEAAACASFVGANEASISNCLSLGKVNINNNSAQFGGGFTWGGEGTYTNCFFSESHTGSNRFGHWDATEGLDDTALLSAATFSDKLSAEFWNISNFTIPELKIAGVAPSVVTPEISITNTSAEIFAGENVAILASITPASNLGIKLESDVAGVTIAHGIVTIGLTVADNTKFTVVAYSLIDNTVKATKEFTVKVKATTKPIEDYAQKQIYELGAENKDLVFAFAESGKITTAGGTAIASTYANGKFTVAAANVPNMVKGTILILRVETDTKIYNISILPITKLIKTKEALQSMQSDLGGYYVLGNDIDCSGLDFIHIGTAAVDVGDETKVVVSHTTALDGIAEVPFTGVFDGNGYTISNLTEVKALPDNYQAINFGFGLFGLVGETGVVQNFTIENANITSGNMSGFVAAVNLGTIKNVKVLGGSATPGYGIHDFAYLNAGTIENCINLTNTGVENFVNKNTGTITNCYSVQTKFKEAGVEYDSVFPIKGTVTNSGFKTLEELKVSTLYSAYDKTIWTIAEATIPTLTKGSIV